MEWLGIVRAIIEALRSVLEAIRTGLGLAKPKKRPTRLVTPTDAQIRHVDKKIQDIERQIGRLPAVLVPLLQLRDYVKKRVDEWLKSRPTG